MLAAEEFEARLAEQKAKVLPPPQPDAAGASCRKMEIEWFDEAARLALEEPNDPLIEGLLDEGSLSVFYGDSNSGKTFVALDIAFAVATGSHWNSRRVRRGLVIYVAAEGGRRIRRRLAALRKRYIDKAGRACEQPCFALIRYPIDLRSSEANLNELLTLIRAAERHAGEQCRWVIVDTLSRAMAGGDENSPVDMGRTVASADRVRAETLAHFTYVHHTGKDAARGARGHSLLRAATDTEIEVTPNEIKVTKQRDMEGGLSVGFDLVDLEIGIDHHGAAIRSAVVEWTGQAGRPVRDKTEKNVPASHRMLVDAIKEAIAQAGQEIRPYADGPFVHASPDSAIRVRYYARLAEIPDEGGNSKALAERRRKSFNRSIKGILDRKIANAVEHKGDRWIWLS
jgi:hypothetical protein